jgi:hypothetical protein
LAIHWQPVRFDFTGTGASEMDAAFAAVNVHTVQPHEATGNRQIVHAQLFTRRWTPACTIILPRCCQDSGGNSLANSATSTAGKTSANVVATLFFTEEARRGPIAADWLCRGSA